MLIIQLVRVRHFEAFVAGYRLLQDDDDRLFPGSIVQGVQMHLILRLFERLYRGYYKRYHSPCGDATRCKTELRGTKMVNIRASQFVSLLRY